MKRKYRVVTYSGGEVKGDFETAEIKEVAAEYAKSAAGNVAVRIWINGKKLTYTESNRLFEAQRRPLGFNRWVRKRGRRNEKSIAG